MTSCLNSVTLQSVEALHFKVLNFKALNQKTGKGPLPGAGAGENTIFKEDTQMIIKVMMLLLFFIIMVGIGFWIRPGRPLRRSLAHSICLRYLLFLRSCLRRVRRPVRLEIRHRCHMGRNRKRSDRFPPCMEDPRQTHKDHDPASGYRYDA